MRVIVRGDSHATYSQRSMTSVKPRNAERRIVDALAFLCEIALLVTLAIAGSRLRYKLPVRILSAVALLTIGVTIWSLRMAPTAKRRLTTHRA
jgi:Protein of unknown function (DUF2568)